MKRKHGWPRTQFGIIQEAACCPLCRTRRNGHGYCTYDFFDQCPHRMACAKCSFYMPKGSTRAALLEGKNNLLRSRQEIPLSDAELAAMANSALTCCQRIHWRFRSIKVAPALRMRSATSRGGRLIYPSCADSSFSCSESRGLGVALR